MPSKGTPHRPIRIDDGTWAKAQAKAARLGTSASAKARELLAEWADAEDDNHPNQAAPRVVSTGPMTETSKGAPT